MAESSTPILSEQLRQLPLPQAVEEHLRAFMATLGDANTYSSYFQVLQAACKYSFPDNILSPILADLPYTEYQTLPNNTWTHFCRDGLLTYFRTPQLTTYHAHVDLRLVLYEFGGLDATIIACINQELPPVVSKIIDECLQEYQGDIGPSIKHISYSCRYDQNIDMIINMTTVYALDDGQLQMAHNKLVADILNQMDECAAGSLKESDQHKMRQVYPDFPTDSRPKCLRVMPTLRHSWIRTETGAG